MLAVVSEMGFIAHLSAVPDCTFLHIEMLHSSRSCMAAYVCLMSGCESDLPVLFELP